jgi:hypothetical protein
VTKSKRRRWYSISVDTLRVVAVPVVALLILGVAYTAYRSWRAGQLEREAHEIIEETARLAERLQGVREVKEKHRGEVAGALVSLQKAREDLADHDFPQAISHGLESRRLLLAIQEKLQDSGFAGQAKFVSVQGDVQFRRGERRHWQTARGRVVLHAGDSVRTGSGGSAEIVFADGALFVLRPNSQVVIAERPGGSDNASNEAAEQAMKMEYGLLNLSTSRNPSKVETPEAEAHVDRNTDAFVGYEKETREGRFGAYHGGMEVRPEQGEAQKVAALEEVVQRNGEVSAPRPLPLAPELRQPPENFEVDLDQVDRLVLTWTPVPGGGQYALQVSENNLFADNIIDASDRTKTEATLGLLGEGSFLWRVAALSRDGAQGPWSPPRRFRVTALAGRSSVEDRSPPVIENASVTPYGNIYIVAGKTEPGATVTINEEPARVDADGTFTKTIQFTRDGWNSVEIRASDAWGNESSLTKPVLVESS